MTEYIVHTPGPWRDYGLEGEKPSMIMKTFKDANDEVLKLSTVVPTEAWDDLNEIQ